MKWRLSNQELDEEVTKLVSVLKRTDPWCGATQRKRDALHELRDLAHDYEQAMAGIVAAGGLAAMVRLLSHRSGGVREAAARVLGNLAADSEPNKADIVAADAVPALLRLLRQDSNFYATREAAEALRNLAAGGEPIKAAVVAAGALPTLVQLVSQGDNRMDQMFAASALCNLASGGEPIRAAILAAGAAPVLVQQLSGQSSAQDYAVWALLNLTDGSSGAPAPKLLNPAEAGSAVPALVRLLGTKDAAFSFESFAAVSTDPTEEEEEHLSCLELACIVHENAPNRLRKAAAAVLQNLAQRSEPGAPASSASQASGSGALTVTAGAATALVQLLGWRSSAVRHVAAVVLGDLACCSEPNKAAALAAGAEPALKQLLGNDSSSSVRTAAAAALASLAAGSRASHSREQTAAPGHAQRPMRTASRADDIDSAQVQGRRPAQPARPAVPLDSAAQPSAPPATSSLLGAGPSAPPATASLLAMLQPPAPPHQSNSGAAMGGQPTAPSPSPVSGSGSGSGIPSPPPRFTAGFHCRTVPFEELKLQRRLGSGSFGTVLLAMLEQTPVAAKVLVKLADGPNGFEVAATLTEQQLAKVQREISLLASISHPNVVQFMCACESPPTIVTEYCVRGSLLDVLKQARTSPQLTERLSWACRLSMALGAARGILHMHNRGIAHRDLKSPNLLVDGGWRVKVADFGFCKALDEDRHSVQSSTMEGVNPKWQAPEVIYGGPATFASDAYAYGCILWELMTWDVPWSGVVPGRIIGLKMNGVHLELPSSPESLSQLPGTDKDRAAFARVAPQYTRLIQQCWAASEADRPAFATIIQQLTEIKEVLSAAA